VDTSKSLKKFELHSEYKPTGDQPEAISMLSEGVLRGDKDSHTRS